MSIKSRKFREFLQFTLWMLKDFFWSLYFAPLAIFACLSTLLVQIFVVYLDSPTLGAKVLNFAEFLWLCGNTTWMFGDMLWDTADTSLKFSDTPLIRLSSEQYHR